MDLNGESLIILTINEHNERDQILIFFDGKQTQTVT